MTEPRGQSIPALGITKQAQELGRESPKHHHAGWRQGLTVRGCPVASSILGSGLLVGAQPLPWPLVSSSRNAPTATGTSGLSDSSQITCSTQLWPAAQDSSCTPRRSLAAIARAHSSLPHSRPLRKSPGPALHH